MDLQKIENPELRKFNGKLCTLYLYGTVGFVKKNEFPEQRKFKGKLCTLYMYKTSGFVEKLNIHNCENSTANFVPYVCTECLDLQKN